MLHEFFVQKSVPDFSAVPTLTFGAGIGLGSGTIEQCTISLMSNRFWTTVLDISGIFFIIIDNKKQEKMAFNSINIIFIVSQNVTFH